MYPGINGAGSQVSGAADCCGDTALAWWDLFYLSSQWKFPLIFPNAFVVAVEYCRDQTSSQVYVKLIPFGGD